MVFTDFKCVLFVMLNINIFIFKSLYFGFMGSSVKGIFYDFYFFHDSISIF